MITEVKRGSVLRINNGSGLPQIRLNSGEILDDVEVYYPAGIYSKPTSGDVLVFFLHADAGLSIAIPCGPLEEIPDMENDEMVIFNPMELVNLFHATVILIQTEIGLFQRHDKTRKN